MLTPFQEQTLLEWALSYYSSQEEALESLTEAFPTEDWTEAMKFRLENMPPEEEEKPKELAPIQPVPKGLNKITPEQMKALEQLLYATSSTSSITYTSGSSASNVAGSIYSSTSSSFPPLKRTNTITTYVEE